ncbi:NUDIX domain-containing protein [Planotetraspora sp. GP83]|uniref:NUDIX hydrolase n=1 Tax=Planotetraspora sp. GP83 TaxID=3156264 RepID=UPI003511D522
MNPVRHSVRAILFDGEDIVLFKRVKPGLEPYWITPGGGVEPTDTSPEMTLRRELDEELGATAGPALRVFTAVEPGRQLIAYACRLVGMDLTRRSGPEFLVPGNGVHVIERVRPEKVRELNLVPRELADFIADSAETLPALLASATHAPGRYRPVVDVHLLLFNGDRVLLGRRQGTGYADGEWQIMPSGHLEEGESVVDTAVREAREELGIDVSGLDVVHVMHHHNAGGTARIGFFLVARDHAGTPINAEPHKCAELGWFPAGDLPEGTVPYARAGIEAVRRKLDFSLHGWEVLGAAELEAEAVRAGFRELSVAVIGHRDGVVFVLSDDETDRLPSSVVRPGETLEAALARVTAAASQASSASQTSSASQASPTSPPSPPSASSSAATASTASPDSPVSAASPGARFVGADDYVAADGTSGRRFTFAAALPDLSPASDLSPATASPASPASPARPSVPGRWLHEGSIDATRMPHSERMLIAKALF